MLVLLTILIYQHQIKEKYKKGMDRNNSDKKKKSYTDA